MGGSSPPNNVEKNFIIYSMPHDYLNTDTSCPPNKNPGESRLDLVKHFVVTSCSKERPVSIVTETLKNGILIPIVTSKKLHFNADLKYITFIKISLTYQKL